MNLRSAPSRPPGKRTTIGYEGLLLWQLSERFERFRLTARRVGPSARPNLRFGSKAENLDESSERQINPDLLVILHQQSAWSWIPKDEYLGGSQDQTHSGGAGGASTQREHAPRLPLPPIAETAFNRDQSGRHRFLLSTNSH